MDLQQHPSLVRWDVVQSPRENQALGSRKCVRPAGTLSRTVSHSDEDSNSSKPHWLEVLTNSPPQPEVAQC